MFDKLKLKMSSFTVGLLSAYMLSVVFGYSELPSSCYDDLPKQSGDFLLHFHSQSLSTPLLQTHLIHRQLILIEKCKILILNLTLKSYTMHNPMHFPLLKVPLQSNSISAINKSMLNMPPGTQNYR